MSELSQEKLLQQAIAGDDQAFIRLMRLNRQRLETYVRDKLPHSLRSIYEPSDVMQDVYQLAFRGIKGVNPQGEDAAYRWLVTIARNRMAEMLRAQQTVKRGGLRQMKADTTDDEVGSLLEQLAVYLKTPSKSAIHHELARDMEACLQNLPADHRQALVLRYFDGLAVDEIAQRMNRTRGAAQMLCSRGLKELRSAMISISRYQ